MAVEFAQAECGEAPKHWISMKKAQVVLRANNQDTLELPVRIADTDSQRRGGFQGVCPELIRNWSILFVFHKDVTAEFHMRRVAEALDIAFFGADGNVLGIQRMQPLSVTKTDRRYRANEPFRFALETGAGRLNQVTQNPTRWRLLDLNFDAQ